MSLFSDLPNEANGEVRVCLDPSNLNKATIREHHKPMMVEETNWPEPQSTQRPML